jgi:xanthine dehydrogenase YagR molybdenum-binding subunit
MATVAWPAAEKRAHIGKRYDRADGPAKATGSAKYSYDINRPGMLYAKVVTSPHALADISGVDTKAASALKGVRAVWVDTDLKEVQYVGQIVAAVAADTEEIATEAAELVKVTYAVKPHQVVDNDPKFVNAASGAPAVRNVGNFDQAFGAAAVRHEGTYGVPVITHCCLEPHGQVTEMQGDSLYIWPSTQNVTGYANQLGAQVGVDQNKIVVETQYMGGGFGSKFNFDKWGVIGATLSKQTGKAVKLMLDRDLEQMIGGNRPSGFGKVKVGLDNTGKITAFSADIVGTGGVGGWNMGQLPYVFTKIPNISITGRRIVTNRGAQRAWRAPAHPQCCFLSQTALADAAAALKMDELDFFLKNLDLTDREEVYKAELLKCADMIGYRKKAHARGDATRGPNKRGLGMAIHTWGGRGHPSQCDITVHSDGTVEVKMGTQDLGTGTRTTVPQVIAETLGIQMDQVKFLMGTNRYPPSGGSGGSTTIGGVSAAARMGATAALNELIDQLAPRMGLKPDQLEASAGAIRQIGNPAYAVPWKTACALLGPNTITKRGVCDPNAAQAAGLINQQVGGAQMADVSVDIETGVVTINEMVAVQDCGLIINIKLAESQVFGALIMGITSALFEEAVYDARTGQMLNADMEFYRLAGIKDVGQLKVHMMTGKGYDERGVIGLGEPPVIAPLAAIANAVANAIGVRVPDAPFTPDRVITALQKGGKLA